MHKQIAAINESTKLFSNVKRNKSGSVNARDWSKTIDQVTTILSNSGMKDARKVALKMAYHPSLSSKK